MQSTIAITCLVNMSEDMSEIVSLEITFKGRLSKVNKVFVSLTRPQTCLKIASLEILSKNLWLKHWDFVLGHVSEHILLYK